MSGYTFSTSAEGLVELDGPPGLLLEALRDCLGSRPPRGARQDGPSTYWVDRALRDMELAVAAGSDAPFASGNATYLRVRDGQMIEARFDVDPEDSDQFGVMGVEELAALLRAWRAAILAVSPEAERRQPPPPPQATPL